MFALRRTALSSRAFSTTSRASLAKINLIGRLGAAPEVTATSTGHEITKYAVAVSSGTKDAPKTSWFNVVSFLEDGPQRAYITGLEKGTLVYVDGEARMDTYEDKDSGKTIKSLSIVQGKTKSE